MANKISDETIEYVGILAKLELSSEEKENAKADMEKMLDYIDTLRMAAGKPLQMPPRVKTTALKFQRRLDRRVRRRWMLRV